MKATHRRWLFALFAAFCALPGARAEAQVPITWDHYKVYRVNPPTTGAFPVILRDQFSVTQHQAQLLEFFANPVEKQVANPPPVQIFPITDPLTHYMWWRINPNPFPASVHVGNQFGDQNLLLQEGLYLLNPALKNQVAGPLPVRNHYKCYSCNGQPVNVPVNLIDQWDTWQTNVVFPRYFCTPVEKQVLGGPLFPIINPNQHYVVYEFTPQDPQIFPALIRDQFHQGTHDMFPGLYLMVPTEKFVVTETTPSTWGKLKVLYR